MLKKRGGLFFKKAFFYIIYFVTALTSCVLALFLVLNVLSPAFSKEAPAGGAPAGEAPVGETKENKLTFRKVIGDIRKNLKKIIKPDSSKKNASQPPNVLKKDRPIPAAPSSPGDSETGDLSSSFKPSLPPKNQVAPPVAEGSSDQFTSQPVSNQAVGLPEDPASRSVSGQAVGLPEDPSSRSVSGQAVGLPEDPASQPVSGQAVGLPEGPSSQPVSGQAVDLPEEPASQPVSGQAVDLPEGPASQPVSNQAVDLPEEPASRSVSGQGVDLPEEPASQPVSGQAVGAPEDPASRSISGRVEESSLEIDKEEAKRFPSSEIGLEIRSYMVPFTYESLGRKDPFKDPTVIKSQIETGIPLPKSPLEKHELAQIKLKGVIWDTKRPKALFQLPGDAGFFTLFKGDKVGKKGIIFAIRESEVVIVKTRPASSDADKEERIIKIKKIDRLAPSRQG